MRFHLHSLHSLPDSQWHHEGYNNDNIHEKYSHDSNDTLRDIHTEEDEIGGEEGMCCADNRNVCTMCSMCATAAAVTLSLSLPRVFPLVKGLSHTHRE